MPAKDTITDGELRALFGAKEMPDVPRFKPVRDDYTAGFANGVEAVLEWLRSLPKIEMPTHQTGVVSIHDMSALEAAIHLEQKIENVRNA